MRVSFFKNLITDSMLPLALCLVFELSVEYENEDVLLSRVSHPSSIFSRAVIASVDECIHFSGAALFFNRQELLDRLYFDTNRSQISTSHHREHIVACFTFGHRLLLGRLSSMLNVAI
jgi:hypothetical protein